MELIKNADHCWHMSSTVERYWNCSGRGRLLTSTTYFLRIRTENNLIICSSVKAICISSRVSANDLIVGGDCVDDLINWSMNEPSFVLASFYCIGSNIIPDFLTHQESLVLIDAYFDSRVFVMMLEVSNDSSVHRL